MDAKVVRIESLSLSLNHMNHSIFLLSDAVMPLLFHEDLPRSDSEIGLKYS